MEPEPAEPAAAVVSCIAGGVAVMPGLGIFDNPMDKFLLRLLEKYGKIPGSPGQAIVPVDPPIGGGSGIPGYGQSPPPRALPRGRLPQIGPGGEGGGGALSRSLKSPRSGPIGGMWGGLGANTLPWITAAMIAQEMAPDDDRRSDVPISPLDPASMFTYSDVAQSLFGDDEAGQDIPGEQIPGGEGPPLMPSHSQPEQDALIEQARVDEFKKSIGYDAAPEPLSQFDKGIAVGEIPSEKLKRIRAEARMKGAGGSLRTPTPDDIDTSGISDTLEPRMLTEVSNLGPEQTQEARDAYLRKLPYESALSDLRTREIYERDPQAVDRAEQLLGLGKEMRYAQQQQAVNKMVDAVSGTSGTIPREMFEKLTMLDPQMASRIPGERIGLSRTQVQNQLYKEMEKMEEISQTVGTEYLVNGDKRMDGILKMRAALMKANSLINQPGSDPTQIWNDFKQTLMGIQDKYAPDKAFSLGMEEEESYSRID